MWITAIVTVLGVLALSADSEALLNLAQLGKGGGVKWTDLKLKYEFPVSGKFNIPLSTGQITNDYRFLKAHEDFDKVSLYIAGDDPRVQLMYDDYENICGLRVAYINDEIAKKTPKGETFPYSYEDKPIFKKGNELGKELYYIDVLFIHPDILKTGGPATRTEPVGTGVYIQMDGKTWTEMPRNEEGMKDTKFTKQACFPGMGRHYFYNMSPEMKCENHHPVFLLYNKYELVGLGLIPFGTFDAEFGKPWFESPPREAIDFIVPSGPTCLKDWVGKYGTISLHIYFRQFSELNCVV
ncbi:uncharacterized protein LOC128996927 [Macrosteles quadrilineatus]|uniref:uncharacterized protein LOC128996927 n=1 Tax=Macrosteles quadrilineatus TaxID=74068 RepID=UPI0023E0981E|nr:uncharacterized protein LOC128996927 [Macrosteles quadrilineatus]